MTMHGPTHININQELSIRIPGIASSSMDLNRCTADPQLFRRVLFLYFLLLLLLFLLLSITSLG